MLSLIIIIVTVIVSYQGFSNNLFFERYVFEIEKILVYRDYKRIVTSGFLHVSWMHLIFNMITLYFFSNGLEASVGEGIFLLIYFAGLIGGNLFSLVVHKHDSFYRSVGASGAISAVVFAVIALAPQMSIRFFPLPIGIPAWIYGLAFVVYSIYGIRKKPDSIGHDAHLGGGLIGMIITIAIYPSTIEYNYLPILLIFIPATVFIYLIISKPGFLLVDKSYSYRSHYSLDERYNIEKHSKEQELDELLDKINKKGIKSLTPEEKEKLESLSK